METMLLVILISLLLFLAFREILCWYYKTNTILRKLNRLELAVNSLCQKHEITLKEEYSDNTPLCPNCGGFINNDGLCPHCSKPKEQ